MSRWLRRALMLVLAAGWVLPSMGQGTVQVIVTGIPPILESPYIADIDQQIEQGRYVVQIVYISPSRQPRRFRLHLTLDRDGETVLDLTSEANTYEPGIHTYRRLDDEPAVLFPISYGELVNLLDAKTGSTGLLPEGTYALTIEAVPEEADLLLPSVPGTAVFEVRYAEPPMLLAPFDQSVLTSQFPVFSWAPIVGAPAGSLFEYELLIVEVLPGQAPFQALESNRELVRQTLLGQTAFVYTADRLPLEKDHTYAWQVRARDAADLMPVLEAGETEFYTFTVGVEGLGGMVASWNYPVNTPFIVHTLANPQEIDPDQTELFLDGPLPIELNGVPTEARFEGVLVDVETQSIIEGQLFIDEPLAIEVSLNPLTDAFSGYAFVAPGSVLTGDDALLLEWNSGLRIDRDGLHPDGTSPARVAYTGLDGSAWTATYSGDIALTLKPFAVTRGRIDFAAEGIARAYADPAGFHVIDRSDPVIAQIPDRLVVGQERLAYVPLKRNGIPVVDAEPQANGLLKLTPRAGTRLEAVFPVFRGRTQGQAPRFDATLQSVTIQSGTGLMAGGSVDIAIPDTAEPFTLDPVGVPLAPASIAIAVRDGAPQIGLTGALTVFGKPVAGGKAVTFSVDPHGVLTGRVAPETVSGTIALDEAGWARLAIEEVRGDVRLPLLGGDTRVFDLAVDGAFRVMAADSVAASAAIGFTYAGATDVALSRFEPAAGHHPIQLGAHALDVNGIDALWLSFADGQAPRFMAALDAGLRFRVGSDTLSAPLQGVELRENGLNLPPQDVNDATPGLGRQTIALGGFDLALLALRIPSTRLAEATSPLDVRLDVDVRPTGGAQTAAIAGLPLTLQDARLDGGFLNGSLIPYPLDRTPARLDLGAPLRMDARRIAGRFFADGSAQGFELLFDGDLAHAALTDAAGARCAPYPATLQWSSRSGWTGGTAPMQPCGPVPAGPIALAFDSARVQIRYDRDALVTWIEGNVTGVRQPLQGTTAPATGTITVDLADGHVVEGSARLDAFEWAYPTASPLFAVDVDEARLDAKGLTFFADSTLAARRLSDDTPARFAFGDTFKLGARPAVANTGRADFIAENARIGTFDETGFSIGRAMEPADLPDRIALPGLSGYLLLRGAAGDPAFTVTRSTRGQTVLTAGSEARLLVTQPVRFTMPVRGEITVNDAFDVLAGAITGETEPLATSLQPLEVVRIAATYSEATRRFSTTLDVRAALPPLLATDSLTSVDARLLLGDDRSLAAVSAAPRSWYDDLLRLAAESLVLQLEDETPTVTFEGSMASALLQSDSTATQGLRFTARYDDAETGWTYGVTTRESAPRAFALGAGTFLLDPMLANRLQANPLPVLSLAGVVQLPARLGETFSLGLAVEIGPAGVYLGRPYSGVERPALIENLLGMQIGRLEWRYDEARAALVASLDGAYTSPLLQNRTAAFRGMEIGLDGAVALGQAGIGAGVQTGTALSLLGAGQTVDVIPGVFRLDSLSVALADQGLALTMAGPIDLPAPSERVGTLRAQAPGSVAALGRGRPAATTVAPSTAALFPSGRATYRVGVDGALEATPVDFGGATLQQADKPAFQMAFGDAAIFQYEAADLDFNPWRPTDARLRAAARLFLRTSSGVEAGDSTRIARTDVSTLPAVAFGRASDLERQPGIVVGAGAPVRYLTAFQAGSGASPLIVGNALFDFRVETVSLPDASSPTVALAGHVRLKTPGMTGDFALRDMTVGPDGLQEAGRADGAATLSFGDMLAIQTGCVLLDQRRTTFQQVMLENEQVLILPDGTIGAEAETPLPVQAYVRFGAACGDTLRVTLADGWFAGVAHGVAAYQTVEGDLGLRIDRLEMPFTPDARLVADVRSADEPLTLDIDGATFLRQTPLTTTGHVRSRQGRPSLALLFSPSEKQLAWIPGLARVTTAGGGLFYRPEPADLELVSLVLNERHNGNFQPNNPAGWPAANAPDLALYLPVDAAILPADSASGITGRGLLTLGRPFTHLDLNGTLLQRDRELEAGLFLALTQRDTLGATLEGTGALTLNFTSVLGGIVPTGFRASADLGWSAFGYGDFVLNDALSLPGRYQAGPDGILLDLEEKLPVATGGLAVSQPAHIHLWYERGQNSPGGYAAFESDLSLMPGIHLGRNRLTGTLLNDRDERLLYAAANVFVDVPFVYTGPLDPWLSIQEGGYYAGDARNMTFRRMVTEARQHSASMPTLAADASARLQEAVRVLKLATTDRFAPALPTVLARPDDALRGFGDALLDAEKVDGKLPETLADLAEGLYADPARPAQTAAQGVPATTTEAADAWRAMTEAVETAERTAESDLFTLGGLAPRSVLWLSDQVDIPEDLKASPLIDATWPNASPTGTGRFEIDPNIQRLQTANLLDFKQRNEALDIQFLRAVGGLEMNLVNLKIARSPDQPMSYARAMEAVGAYYGRQTDAEWSLREWASGRRQWLAAQERQIDRSLDDQLNAVDDKPEVMRSTILGRIARIRDIAGAAGWENEIVTDEAAFRQRVTQADAEALKGLYRSTGKWLWFDAPAAALAAAADTLGAIASERAGRYELLRDSIAGAYSAYTRALDPMYDMQTAMTTTLYGMAEEYKNWRSSMRQLDPEAVNLAFQFLPYRGNYRILAEDLIPPTLDALKIGIDTTGYTATSTISWSASHPIEVAETSVAITAASDTAAVFASVASLPAYSYTAIKRDVANRNQTYDVTVRVRGAGGLTASRSGRFTVPVDPAAQVPAPRPDSLLVPQDDTPPPAPAIAELTYSAYFSDEPNTLAFTIDALRDPESGIASLAYRIVNEQDANDVLQDWTQVVTTTPDFPGRRIETGLPVQERNLAIRVQTRAENGAGLRSESSASLRLSLDDTPPVAALRSLTYFNPFSLENPNSLLVEFEALQDAESGIQRVEYVLVEGLETNLAEADWEPLTTLRQSQRDLGARTEYLPLAEDAYRPRGYNLNAIFRVTNGAGLQTIARRTIQIPGRDATAPSEPQLTLAHSGFYTPGQPSQLHILLNDVHDVESGIDRLLFRVLDGATGRPIYDWDDFVLLAPNQLAFYLESLERSLPLPRFDSGRPVIVEARAINRAGVTSRTSVAFLQLDVDDTAPPAPAVEVAIRNDQTQAQPEAISLNVGPVQDPESFIAAASYRLVDPASQAVLVDWRAFDFASPSHQFPGASIEIDPATLPASRAPEVQVRVTNGQGLSAVSSQRIALDAAASAPATPDVTLFYSDAGDDGAIHIVLKPIANPMATPSAIRYRLRDADAADRVLVPWQDVPVTAGERFAGRTGVHALPDSLRIETALAELVVENRQGQAFQSHAILSIPRAGALRASRPSAPALDLFFYDAANRILTNTLELGIGDAYDARSEIASVAYRVTLTDAAGEQTVRPSDTTWYELDIKPGVYFAGERVQIGLPDLAYPAQAVAEVRLTNEADRTTTASTRLALAPVSDDTPPVPPALTVFQLDTPQRNTPARLRIVAGSATDPESGVEEMAYRLIDPERPTAPVADWTPLTNQQDERHYAPAPATVTVPPASTNRPLLVQLRTRNGIGLESLVESPITLVSDRTPPVIEGLAAAAAGPAYAPDRIDIVPGLIADPESPIDRIAYRVALEGDTTSLIQDWTVVDEPEAPRLRARTLSVPLPNLAGSRTVSVEVRAENAAGLETTASTRVAIEIDTTPPQMPRIDLAFVDNTQGEGYLLVTPGAFRDAESLIAGLDYRIYDASGDSSVFRDWTRLPVPNVLRTSTPPFSIPRTAFPFDGAREVTVEFRAQNGAGLFAYRQGTIAIPGDVTPPDTPALQVVHHNAYDAQHPNSLELQIGPAGDAQSSITDVAYRIRIPGATEATGAWTSVSRPTEERFPGTLLYADLPFLASSTVADVEVRVVNSAGLVTTTASRVDVVIESDITPPSLEIALHYFSDQMALVLNELSDPESRIHEVEYRFLDNVDQTVLADWKPVFEISVPQDRFERQIYAVEKPTIRSGRTLKVEVRATNGAGLQTLVSKTVLFKTPGIGQ
ncbi:MAG: hypothetical protein R2834_16485 [Rhodothermales bacterium]